MGASRSVGADIQVGRRGVRRPFGRFVIGNQELTVRSSPTRWIRARSASRDAVGEISFYERVEIHLPILHWRRLDNLRFEDPESAFFGVSLMLPRRKQIIEELRARGYSVTDRRACSPTEGPAPAN
jgi:hypothetical protein